MLSKSSIPKPHARSFVLAPTSFLSISGCQGIILTKKNLSGKRQDVKISFNSKQL